jgi:hypothetical protein
MKKAKFLLLSLIVITGVSLGSIWLFNVVMGDVPNKYQRSHAYVQKALQQHIREADRKAADAISKRVSEFTSFIDSRKSGAKPFSEDVVSLKSKWLVFKSKFPFTDKDGHKNYIVQKFGQHIFTQEDLALAVKRTVEASIKDLDGIENELAVAMRQEILGRTLRPDEVPIASDKFKSAIALLVTASQWDVTKSVGSLVVSEVAAQVATQVLVRVGISGGILAAGAATSVWTAGAGMAIGLVVDAIWGWIDNPAEDIEREMIQALNRLSSESSAAIRDEMNKVCCSAKCVVD